jgi:hypothetical protein
MKDNLGWQANNFASYNSVCRQAAADDSAFDCFRSNQVYTTILAHDDDIQKTIYLKWLKDHDYSIFDIDSFGDPYSKPSLCTVRYSSTFHHMNHYELLFDGMTVCEIGAGYGGQALVIGKNHNVKFYVTYDLDGPAALQTRVLKDYGENIESFDCRTLLSKESDPEYDLVISNYALSELDREGFDAYFDRVIKKSKSGYFQINPQTRNPNCYTKEEIIEKLGSAYGSYTTVEDHFCKPQYQSYNFILIGKSS